MQTNKLMEELERDEGIIYEIYKDHLGYPTFGIGHLIIDGDPEMGLPVGTPVTVERTISAFNEDIQIVLGDCYRLFSDFDDLPEEAQVISWSCPLGPGDNDRSRRNRVGALGMHPHHDRKSTPSLILN